MDILIVKEKHGDRYFDASTPEKLHAACVKILTQRLKEGWYTPGKEPKCDHIDLSTVPESLLQEAKDKICRQEREHKYWWDNRGYFDDVKRVISEPCILFRTQPKSYCVLEMQSGYENVHLDSLEAVDD